MNSGNVYQSINPRDYYSKLLEYRLRPDGRHLNEIRPIHLTPNVLSSEISSSIASLGGSRYLAGVSAEIGPPDPSFSETGRITVQIDFPRSCANETDSIPSAHILKQRLEQIINNPKCIDLTQLCIKKGEAVWTLYVNIVCIEYDGHPFDCCLMAAAHAIKNVCLPSVYYSEPDGWWVIYHPEDISLNNSSSVPGEDTSSSNIKSTSPIEMIKNEVDEESENERNYNDISKSEIWEGKTVILKQFPVSITIEQIGNTSHWIVDPTMFELSLGHAFTLWILEPGTEPYIIPQYNYSNVFLLDTKLSPIKLDQQLSTHLMANATNKEIGFLLNMENRIKDALNKENQTYNEEELLSYWTFSKDIQKLDSIYT